MSTGGWVGGISSDQDSQDSVSKEFQSKPLGKMTTCILLYTSVRAATVVQERMTSLP